MRLTIRQRLVLMIAITALFTAFLVLSLFQMAKGAQFHHLNALHLKHVMDLQELMELQGRIGASGSDPVASRDLRRVIHDIRVQPMECLNMINALDRLIMHGIGTDIAIRLCEEDIALADRLLTLLARHERGELGHTEMLAGMRSGSAQFIAHSDQFMRPISATTDFIIATTLGLFVVLALAMLASMVVLARGITGSVTAMGQATRALEESERRNRQLAHFDTLTGLPNRNLLQDRLAQAIALAQRNGGGLALLFLDLDRFKNVNDSLGHAAGDILLLQAGERLQGVVRSSDTVARLGGDEFTIIMYADTAPDMMAARVAQKVLTALSEPFMVHGSEVYVGASIGITIYPQDAQDADTLLKNADLAMYKAKAGGKNRFEYYLTELDRDMQRRLHIEHLLHGAIARGEMQLHYQPVVEMGSSRVAGAEALLRWTSPELGAIAPDEFIAIAEETGQIGAIGLWVLEKACRQCAVWRKEHDAAFRMAVNVSVRQLHAGHFTDAVRAALTLHGLPAEALGVEVTESQMIEDEESLAALRALSDMGVQLLLDDFGRGYSSFGYLQTLPFNILKIDRCFMSVAAEGSQDGRDMLGSIIAMAHRMNMQVVAEGVETDAAARHLLAHGCDFAQGYYFGRPLPADDFFPAVTAAALSA